MSKLKIIFNNLGVIFGVLAIASLVAYADVWQPPTAVPPGNNTATPINVSAANQVKIGGLAVGPLAVFGDALVSGVYKQGGGANINSGITLNCAAGQTIGAPIVSGGIVTGGACGAGGGGGGLGAYEVKAQFVPDATPGSHTVRCAAGKRILGGGCFANQTAQTCLVHVSAPVLSSVNSGTPTQIDGWRCEFKNSTGNVCGGSATEIVYAICG